MDDQTLQVLLDSLQGRTEKEIHDLIVSSSNAGAVTDPATLAAYLVSKMV